MLKYPRILFKIFIVLVIGMGLFSALMFGAKIWGIYCIPPSEENLKGATLIVSRDEDEPFLNASDRPEPPPSPKEPAPTGFGAGVRVKRSIEKRTIFKLPFIGFLHEAAKDTTSS